MSVQVDPSATVEEPPKSMVAGRYRLLEIIARGGMGSVYRAEHTLSKKKMALKLVHPHLTRGRHAVERFRREVSAAAEIGHPGIVQVYDAGVDTDGSFYIAMELLDGESLGDLLRRHWPGMRSSVTLIEEMLEPLAAAHDKGFVHRDLKPDNIFIARTHDKERQIKLLDFGLVREVGRRGPTRTGSTFGTPEYMSPEQATSARKVEAPGDVWSVGVLLYELLAGTHPFEGETANAIMANVIKEKHQPLIEVASHVPKALADIVESTLHKDPSERPQNAGELLAMLRTLNLELEEVVPDNPRRPFGNTSDEDDGGLSFDPILPKSIPIPISIQQAEERSAIAKESTLPPSRSRKKGGLRGVLTIAVVLLMLAFGVGIFFGLRDRPTTPPGEEGHPDEGGETNPPIAGQGEGQDPGHGEGGETNPPIAGEGEGQDPGHGEGTPDIDPTIDEEGSTSLTGELDNPETGETDNPEAGETDNPETGEGGEGEEENEVRQRTPGERAQELVARGDNAGAIALLQRSARSSRDRITLIDMLRTQGRTDEMHTAMLAFVRRYPRHRNTEDYTSRLRRYGYLHD